MRPKELQHLMLRRTRLQRKQERNRQETGEGGLVSGKPREESTRGESGQPVSGVDEKSSEIRAAKCLLDLST